MKNFKKVVAGLLAVLMLALSVNVSFAEEEYSEKETVVVAKVNGSGIMTGTDKGFEPSKSLTRAEAAAIIVRMKGISESAVKASAGTTLFTDVAASHWAAGYVNQASNLGIVKGVSATQFAPDREVTIAEFTTMAVRALGAGQLVDSEGTWPTNYVNFANENGILDDVNSIYTGVATRMQAATIVVNTLEAKMWEKTGVQSTGEITWSNQNGNTILKSVLDIDLYKDGTISGVDIKDRKLSWTENVEDGKFLNNKNVSETVDLATIKAAVAYDVWYKNKDKKIVAVFGTENSKSATVEFTGIKKLNEDKITVIEEGKEVKYSLCKDDDDDDVITVYYLNGNEADGSAVAYTEDEITGFADADHIEDVFGTLVLVDNKVKAIYAYRYTALGIVDKVTDTKVEFAELDTALGYLPFEESFKFDSEDDLLYIVKDGKEIKLEDLEEDDVVVVYEDDDDDAYHMVVITNTVEGEITAVSKNSYISVDGSRYSLTKDMKGITTWKAGSDVKLFLNEKDEIIAYDAIEKESEYAILKSIEVVNGRKGLDVEVILAYTNGTESETLKLKVDDDNASDLGIDALITGTTDKTASGYNTRIKTAGTTPYLGKLVDYEISKDEVELRAVTVEDTAVKFVKGKSKSSFVDEAATVGDPDVLVAYINDSTDILFVKDGSKKYNRKVTKLDAADLATSTGLSVELYEIEDGIAGIAVVTENTGKLKNNNKSDDWMIVSAVADIDKDDYKFEYTLLDVNGDVTTARTKAKDYNVGDMGIVTISGDELVDIDTDDYKDDVITFTKDGYLAKVDDGLVYLYDVNPTGSTWVSCQTVVLSDSVLYLKDGDELKASKLSNIDKVSYDKDATTSTVVDTKEANEIKTVYIEKNDDSFEVVAIVYVD